MSTPKGTNEPERSAETDVVSGTDPGSGTLIPAVNEKFRCGTLLYTKRGLFILFGWLLWGDFCFTVFEAVGGPGILGLYLQDNFHVSMFQVNIALSLLPRIIAIVVGPVLSFKSDRHRGRWGRRIPFMLFTTPFLCLFAAAVGFSDQIIAFMKAHIGPDSFVSPLTVGMVAIGFMAVGFTFFNEFVQNVYWYLFADVVPEAYMGRFIGLFRTVGNSATFLLNIYIMPHQLTHMLWIHVGVAALYFFGFGAMCLGVKEGKYPPVTDVTERTTFWEKTRLYFTECMSHRIYRLNYLVTFFTAMSTIIGVAGIFNLHVDQHKMTVPAHTGGPSSLAMSADGKFAISGGADHLVKLWNCAGSKEFALIKTLDGHAKAIRCVAISADGGTAVSGDADGQIKVWNVSTGECLKTLSDGEGAFSPWPWSAESPWMERLETLCNRAVKCIALLRDGNTLISGGDDGKVRIWDLRTGELAKTLEGHSSTFNSIVEQLNKIGIEKPVKAVNCISISSDEQLVATGSSDKTIRLWNASDWSVAKTLTESPGPVYALCFSPALEAKREATNDQIPVVGDVVNYFKEVFSNDSLYKIPVDSRSKVVAGDQWLLSGGRDGKENNQNSMVRIWDVNAGKLVRSLKGHKGAITSLQYKRDLHMIFSGSMDSSVRLWDPVDISAIATDQSLRSISGYTTGVTAFGCKPEGPIMVNASETGQMHLWDVDQGISLKKSSWRSSFFGGLLAILLAFPTGMLVDRFHALRITIIATFLLAPAQAAYYWFMHDYMSTVWMDCFRIPLFCLLGAAQMPLSMLIFPKAKYGQFCAAASTIRSLAVLGGGVLGALVVDWYTGNTLLTDNFRYGFLWQGVTYLLIGYAWVLVYKEWKKLGGDKYVAPDESTAK